MFENNLFERDADGQGPGFCPQEGLTFAYNTEVISIPEASFAGNGVEQTDQRRRNERGGCTPGHNYNIEHNLFVEIPCTHIVPGFIEGDIKNGKGSPAPHVAAGSEDLV